jgi:hypothetical protein
MKDKYYFLLCFPILYMVPPFHETVHVLIAWAFGIKILKIEWALTTYSSKGSSLHWFLQHNVWDSYYIMSALCVVSITLFICYFLKAHHVVVNWNKIRRDLKYLNSV